MIHATADNIAGTDEVIVSGDVDELKAEIKKQYNLLSMYDDMFYVPKKQRKTVSEIELKIARLTAQLEIIQGISPTTGC